MILYCATPTLPLHPLIVGSVCILDEGIDVLWIQALAREIVGRCAKPRGAEREREVDPMLALRRDRERALDFGAFDIGY